MNRALEHLKLSNSLKKQDWETPKHLLDQWCEKLFIRPQLDVCATKQSAKFPMFFSKKDDGLSKEWKKPWFCNPPYNDINSWMKKAVDQHSLYGQDGLFLVFNKTDTSWFHKYVWDSERLSLRPNIEVYYQKGRIRFSNSDNSAPSGNMWIVFSNRTLEQRSR